LIYLQGTKYRTVGEDNIWKRSSLQLLDDSIPLHSMMQHIITLTDIYNPLAFVLQTIF